MKYIVYCGEDKTQIPDFIVNPSRTWEKDTTELGLDIIGNTLFYEIENPSARTQYLLEHNKLGLGIFVEENPSWLSDKIRSKTSKKNHLTRHCVKVIRINSYSGVYNLNNIDTYSGVGCLSNQLTSIFIWSADYQDPYRNYGTENVAIGIGRMYDMDEENWLLSCFRPYNVSDYMEIEVVNK